MMRFKDHESFQRFMKSQADVIRDHKTAEMTRLGCDPGQRPSLEWIRDHANDFRRAYMESHPEDFIDG